MKKLNILSILLIMGVNSFSQTVNDMVRYAITTNTGSARTSAMGGAFGALGGDMSAFHANPAGIGVFRKSEVSITPYLNIANTSSDSRSVRKASLQLASLGGVAAFYNQAFDWKGFNFGINYTNLNNFNQKTNQFVYHSPTNYPLVWANEANLALSYNEEIPVRSLMAYNVGLLEWNQELNQYEPTLWPAEEVSQHMLIKEEGYQGEYDFTFGTNYKDKLYLGLGIGIQTIRYKYRSVYTGKGDQTNFYGIDQYNFNQYLKTEGVGTNFKVGLIYRPLPEIRIGAAIHTPTYFSLTDDYEENMRNIFFEADEEGYDTYESFAGPYRYNYDMQTPWKAMFSLATVLMQKAIISLDYEFNNYHSAKYSNGEEGYDFYEPDGNGANNLLHSELKNTHNLRFGAEYRTNSVLSLRAGYAYWASPYRHTSAGKIQAVSGGFGLNFGQFYCDAAYIYKFAENTTYFYNYKDPEDPLYDVIAEPVKNKYANHEGKITLGVRF